MSNLVKFLFLHFIYFINILLLRNKLESLKLWVAVNLFLYVANFSSPSAISNYTCIFVHSERCTYKMYVHVKCTCTQQNKCRRFSITLSVSSAMSLQVSSKKH